MNPFLGHLMMLVEVNYLKLEAVLICFKILLNGLGVKLVFEQIIQSRNQHHTVWYSACNIDVRLPVLSWLCDDCNIQNCEKCGESSRPAWTKCDWEKRKREIGSATQVCLSSRSITRALSRNHRRENSVVYLNIGNFEWWKVVLNDDGLVTECIPAHKGMVLASKCGSRVVKCCSIEETMMPNS